MQASKTQNSVDRLRNQLPYLNRSSIRDPGVAAVRRTGGIVSKIERRKQRVPGRVPDLGHAASPSSSRPDRLGDTRDRSRGHRGTVRRGRRGAATGRRGIKIEITSRAQGGATQWLDSVTDAIPNSSPREASSPRRSAISHGRTPSTAGVVSPGGPGRPPFPGRRRIAQFN